jgi:hypothetical protein
MKSTGNVPVWFSLQMTSPFLTFVLYRDNSVCYAGRREKEGGCYVIVVFNRLVHTKERLLKSSTW